MCDTAASDQDYDHVFDSYESSIAYSSLHLQVCPTVQCYGRMLWWPDIPTCSLGLLQGIDTMTAVELTQQSAVTDSPVQMKPLVSESPIGSVEDCKSSTQVHTC